MDIGDVERLLEIEPLDPPVPETLSMPIEEPVPEPTPVRTGT